MRTARINKQKMWYSLPGESDPVYVLDENGNIVYESYTDTDGNIIYITDDDGNRIPKMTGNTEQTYNEPVEFMCGISARIQQALIEAYGINDTTMYAQMDYLANEFPFVVGTLVWKRAEPTLINGQVDKDTADYTVKAVLDEYPNVHTCLLERMIRSGEENNQG